MTTQDAKSKVLKFVRDANPSNLELKFGCRVVIKQEDVCDWNKGRRLIYSVTLDNAGDGEHVCDFMTTLNKRYDVSDIKEILGSYMGLQELLIALEKNIDVSGMHPESQGMAAHDRKIEIWQDIADGYDLSENLHNQDKKDPNFYLKLLPLLSNE